MRLGKKLYESQEKFDIGNTFLKIHSDLLLIKTQLVHADLWDHLPDSVGGRFWRRRR